MCIRDRDEEDVESENQLLNSEEMNPEFRGEHTSYSNNKPGFQPENPNQSQKSGIPVCMELAADILPEILEEAPVLTTKSDTDLSRLIGLGQATVSLATRFCSPGLVGNAVAAKFASLKGFPLNEFSTGEPTRKSVTKPPVATTTKWKGGIAP